MKISQNIEVLEVTTPRGTIYPTLVWDDEHLALFDAGYPGTANLIVEAANKAGHDLSQLTDLVLTHQDVDHIGGARELLELAPQMKVHAHKIDTPFIDGSETPTKLAGLEEKKAKNEDYDVNFYNFLQKGFAVSTINVDYLLEDKDILEIAGGIEGVFTPGHTPGHAAFYLKESKLMIVGDAANISDGQLIGSNPKMTWDIEQAEKSLQKLKTFPVNGYISYHTGYLDL